MKIAISGASGFVGQMLVPRLAAAGANLLLIGRNPRHLAQLFPGHAVCGYADLAARAQGHDMLLHLAVLNSDAIAPPEAFTTVNVDFTLALAETAQKLGIARFLHVSSVHALDPRNTSAYAQSKRAAANRLAALAGIHVTTLHLAQVYGEGWGGRLKGLNRLPPALAQMLFRPLAALKPTVHIRHLAAFVLHPMPETSDEIILADDQDANLIFRAVKRLIDLLFVAAVAVLLGWALGLIWVLVRLQSPGPGLFAQTRVGRQGATFTCYKFRSMQTGTVQVGTHDAPEGAITRLGHILRRSKLDELPQIWNIARGEMSLIGPRPCLPVQTALIDARRKRGVLDIRPGISGLAQVQGIDMRDPLVLARRDARYMAIRGLALDVKIILATLRPPRG